MKNLYRLVLPLLGIGLLAGFLNGLLGAGGGIAVVMGLRALFGKKGADPRSFYATAIAVMLPLSALTVWQYATGGHLPSLSLWGIVLPAAAGGATGAFLLRHIAPQILNRIFAAIVVLSGIILVM